jgi:regulator of sigma E protease
MFFDLHQTVVAIIAFIVLLGIMVVVHEFGHFAVAKLCGVRVEAFSVGFGPRLFGIKYGDTDYKVCLLPLGGYVKMTGETPGEERALASGGDESKGAKSAPAATFADDPGAFTSHPRWQRMLIGLAGPTSNFLLAFVAMTVYYNWFNEVPDFKNITIEWVAADSAGARAGLAGGDVITQFDGISNPSWDQIEIRTNHLLGKVAAITVDRNGATIATHIQLPEPANGKEPDLPDAGIYLHSYNSPIKVDSVTAGTPAEAAGLKGGDRITAVDGHAFHSVPPLLSYLEAGGGKPVTLTVMRGGKELAPMIAHPSRQDSAWKLGFAALGPDDPPMHREPLPFGMAVGKSKSFCVENSTVIVDVLKRILKHQVSVKQLSGPVGIAQMAGQAAQMDGWMPKFGLASAISLNLGILNLLPFPILDGGLILLLLIESGMRHDINMVVKERIYQAAFVVLVAFAAFIIFNDVTKLRMH